MSYCGLLLFSSDESSAIQQKNEKFCEDSTDALTAWLPRRTLRPLNPTPSCRITIIENNCRGIPSSFVKPVNYCCRARWRLLHAVSDNFTAAIACLVNFQEILGPKGLMKGSIVPNPRRSSACDCTCVLTRNQSLSRDSRAYHRLYWGSVFSS